MPAPPPAMPANVSLTIERTRFPHLCPDRSCNADARFRSCSHQTAQLTTIHGLSNTSTIRHFAKMWAVNERTHEIVVRGQLDQCTDLWYVSVIQSKR